MAVDPWDWVTVAVSCHVGDWTWLLYKSGPVLLTAPPSLSPNLALSS